MQTLHKSGALRLGARRPPQGARAHGIPRSVRAWSEAPQQAAKPEGGHPVVLEDVLARYQASEEEAARLRKQLAEAKAKIAELVDSQAAVNKRLFLGGLAAAGLAAAALVSKDKLLPPRPPKALVTYLVDLLRIRALLDQLDGTVAAAAFEPLRSILARIKGQPNYAKMNLEMAVAYIAIDNAWTASRAQEKVVAFLQLLDQVDYNGSTTDVESLSDVEIAEFKASSAKALAAAKTKLDALLALMPEDELEAARAQLRPSGYIDCGLLEC